MMTETCRQFKRIDFGSEKRSVDFLLAKFRFKHYTDCNANQLGITLGRDRTPRFEGVRLVLQSRSDSSGLPLRFPNEAGPDVSSNAGKTGAIPET